MESLESGKKIVTIEHDARVMTRTNPAQTRRHQGRLYPDSGSLTTSDGNVETASSGKVKNKEIGTPEFQYSPTHTLLLVRTRFLTELSRVHLKGRHTHTHTHTPTDLPNAAMMLARDASTR